MGKFLAASIGLSIVSTWLTFYASEAFSQESLPQDAIYRDFSATYKIAGSKGALYSSTVLFKTFQHADNVVRASIPLNNCSGTLISPDGYVLTALHCLGREINSGINFVEGTNLRNGRLTQKLGERTISDINQNQFFVEFIPVRTNYVTKKTSSSKIQFQVIYTGKAVAFELPEWDSTKSAFSLSEKQVDTWRNNLEDFAIIKLDINQLNRVVKCVPARKTPALEGENVFSVGYPKGFYSVDFRFETSFLPIISSGVTGPSQAPKSASTLRNLTDPSSTFLSNTWVKGGMSGGGIFDENGNLLGVNAVSTGEETEAGMRPYLLSFQVSYIIKRLREDGLDELANSAFSCHD